MYAHPRAAARRVPRVEVDGYRRFVRREQRRRMSSAVLGAARFPEGRSLFR
jgi:hypothetical protein